MTFLGSNLRAAAANLFLKCQTTLRNEQLQTFKFESGFRKMSPKFSYFNNLFRISSLFPSLSLCLSLSQSIMSVCLYMLFFLSFLRLCGIPMIISSICLSVWDGIQGNISGGKDFYIHTKGKKSPERAVLILTLLSKM